MAKRNISDIPSTEQLRNELHRLRYRGTYFKVFRSTFGSLLTAAAFVTLIAVLVFPVLRISGQSMSPTLSSGDLILCSKATDPEAGDVIAFYYNKKILIKRVIGTGGDVINISEDGSVWVNDTLLDEPYVTEAALGECDISFPYTVPNTKFFVMGDDRAASLDSRSSIIGCVMQENVIGKIYLVLWPFERFGSVS